MRQESTIYAITSLVTLLAASTSVAPVRADIFQWEYINPANPGAGKRQSTTPTPGGAGVTAEIGANLSNRNLTKAYLINADLSPNVGFDLDGNYYRPYTRANLTSATLTNADLSGAQFNAATMTGANLTNAEVRGANFDRYDQYGYSFNYGYGTGITMAQLASTASYAAHDLTGISLGMHNLTGANLAGFNLTDARFAGANLTNVNFSNANLTGGVISGTLTGMNLSNAEVRGANLWGVTKAQLYSTASYQSGDLTGIYLYSEQTNWNFAGKNLSGMTFQSSMKLNNSNFTGANLTGMYLSYVNVANSDFSQANLTDAEFSWGKLTGANLTGAEVRGAIFSRDPSYPGSGLSLAQLTSTASYQAHDLSGISLRGNVLNGANLAGQNLTDADMVGASLVGANLTGAEVRGAQFHVHPSGPTGGLTSAQLQSTASHQNHDLRGIGLGGNNLAGVNLSGQNLAHANFQSEYGEGANLSGANLNQAVLTSATLGATTLAGATLVEANLANLDLRVATFTNANLSQANLFGSNFSGYYVVVPGEEGGYYHFPGTNLSGADLRSAKLHFANFSGTEDYLFGFPHPGANLTNADLSGADARGGSFLYATMTGANTANLIQSNGRIAGLDLTAGKSLLVRDYELFIGDDVPIVIDQHLVMDATGTLRLEFDADPWGSTISFAPGISVTLGGTLDLAFAADVNVASQLGRTIDLFDWTGVNPAGAFTVSSPYSWDLTKLYTTGEVTLTAAGGLIPGDFNGDSVVNAADLAQWKSDFGTNGASDADGDGDSDGTDFLTWQRQLGQGAPAPLPTAVVPEPVGFALLVSAAACFMTRLRGRFEYKSRTPRFSSTQLGGAS